MKTIWAQCSIMLQLILHYDVVCNVQVNMKSKTTIQHTINQIFKQM